MEPSRGPAATRFDDADWQALAQLRALLAGTATGAADASALLFSSLARTGIEDAALLLHRWAHPAAAAAAPRDAP